MKLKVVLAALGALGLAAQSASAALIGVNFATQRAANAADTNVTGPAGVITQDNWNNETGGTQSITQPLVFSDNTPSGALLTWSSTNTWDVGGTPTNQNANLMHAYLDNTLATNSVATVTNLPSSIAGTGTTPYSVIVYMAGDTAGRGGSWNINGTVFSSYVSKGPSNDGVFVEALPGAAGTGVGATQGNYAVFTGITGTTLTIRAQAESIGNNQRLPFDGFQVVTGTVPEPTGVGLLGMAAMGLIARRRRAAATA
jgi:hypothetical protein